MCRILLTCGATIDPDDGRAVGELLDAARVTDPDLGQQIEAIDPRPKPPFPCWINEARVRGIERIEYVRGRGMTLDIAVDPERRLLVGDGEGGNGTALSAEQFLANPANSGWLRTVGLAWLEPYVRKMADGTRFGIEEILRGDARIVRSMAPERRRRRPGPGTA